MGLRKRTAWIVGLLLASVAPLEVWGAEAPPPAAAAPTAPAASTAPASPAASTAPAASTPAPAMPDTPKALRTLDEFTGRNSLGLMVGLGSGTGLSYRRYLTDRFALRGTGYIFYLNNVASLYHIGASALFDFRRDDRFVLYGVGGVGFAQAKDPAGESSLLTLDMGIFPHLGVGGELGNHTKPGIVYQGELVLTPVLTNGSLWRLLPLPHLGVSYIF